MLIDDLSQVPASFKDGYRGILLIHRNKDGAFGNAQRKSLKKISSDESEWNEIVLEFRQLQLTSHQEFRIYSSVNSRDIRKSIHEFKRRQLEADFGYMYDLNSFYCDIKNRFFSCFMNPSCRAEDYFLIDCDSKEEYEHAELQLRSSGLVVMQYPTKNGVHIITKPFNPNDYGNMQIKKDALMLIG